MPCRKRIGVDARTSPSVASVARSNRAAATAIFRERSRRSFPASRDPISVNNLDDFTLQKAELMLDVSLQFLQFKFKRACSSVG